MARADSPRRSTGKLIGFAAVAAALFVGVLELASWGVVTALPDHFRLRDLEAIAYRPEEIRRSRNLFHPLLGWNRTFDSPWGGRPLPDYRGEPLLAAYGDSFAFCDEVEDHETWQVHLSRLLDGDVLNFGVNAYGTDQAFLKYKFTHPEVDVPVVTLGFLLENINRCRTVFRRFYVLPKSSIPFPPKPRFILDAEGALSLVRSPVGHRKELARMADPEFLATLGAHDDYYVTGFPYLRLVGAKIGELLTGGDATAASWRDPQQRALMFGIFDAFVALARERGSEPVLFLEPEKEQIGADPTPAEDAVVGFCEQKGYRLFNSIRALTERTGGEGVARLFARRGHASAEGNALLAEALHEFLREEGLLEPQDK